MYSEERYEINFKKLMKTANPRKHVRNLTVGQVIVENYYIWSE